MADKGPPEEESSSSSPSRGKQLKGRPEGEDSGSEAESLDLDQEEAQGDPENVQLQPNVPPGQQEQVQPENRMIHLALPSTSTLATSTSFTVPQVKQSSSSSESNKTVFSQNSPEPQTSASEHPRANVGGKRTLKSASERDAASPGLYIKSSTNQSSSSNEFPPVEERKIKSQPGRMPHSSGDTHLSSPSKKAKQNTTTPGPKLKLPDESSASSDHSTSSDPITSADPSTAYILDPSVHDSVQSESLSSDHLFPEETNPGGASGRPCTAPLVRGEDDSPMDVDTPQPRPASGPTAAHVGSIVDPVPATSGPPAAGVSITRSRSNTAPEPSTNPPTDYLGPSTSSFVPGTSPTDATVVGPSTITAPETSSNPPPTAAAPVLSTSLPVAEPSSLFEMTLGAIANTAAAAIIKEAIVELIDRLPPQEKADGIIPRIRSFFKNKKKAKKSKDEQNENDGNDGKDEEDDDDVEDDYDDFEGVL